MGALKMSLVPPRLDHFFQSSQAGGRRGSHQPEIADWLLVTPQNLWLLPHCLRSKFKQNTNATTPTNANRSKNININTTLNWLLVPPHCASFIVTANLKSNETIAHIYVIRFLCDVPLYLPLYYLQLIVWKMIRIFFCGQHFFISPNYLSVILWLLQSPATSCIKTS